jgi:anti-anti-sigma factor
MITTLIKTRIAVVEPKGSIDVLNAEDFKAELTSYVTNYPAVLLDLQGIDFLDSSGIMAIVSAYRLAQSLGKGFDICSAAPSVKMVFELTQLDIVFEIFESREQFESSLG